MSGNTNSSETWNLEQHRLARAVYEAAKSESAYAPIDRPPGPANFLMRSIPSRFLDPGASESIPHSTVLEALRARDADDDYNRFSGVIASRPMLPDVPRSTRGGLYLSEDVGAQMAELYHYADPKLDKNRFGNPNLYKVVEPRGFAVFRPRDELDLVNLTGDSTESKRFLDKLQSGPGVGDCLRANHYSSLINAVLDSSNNAAGRGLALGLATNPSIAGIQVPSARDYETEVGGMNQMQTGNNIVLFVENGATASDMLQVCSVQLIVKTDDDALVIQRFEPRSVGGPFELSETRSFPA